MCTISVAGFSWWPGHDDIQNWTDIAAKNKKSCRKERRRATLDMSHRLEALQEWAERRGRRGGMNVCLDSVSSYHPGLLTHKSVVHQTLSLWRICVFSILRAKNSTDVRSEVAVFDSISVLPPRPVREMGHEHMFSSRPHIQKRVLSVSSLA